MLFIIMVIKFLHASDSYKPGYIITNEGDTIKGKLLNKNWSFNPAQISMQSGTGKLHEYTPAQIQLFFVQPDEYYVSAQVDLDVTPINVEHLILENQPIIKKDTAVFLRVLVRGPMSLYSMHDVEHKRHYFIQYKEEPITELINFVYKMPVNGNPQKVTLSKYRNQLKTYFTKCRKLLKDVSELDFTRKHLQRTVEAFNSCVSKDGSEYVRKPEPINYQIGPVIGFASTSLDFKGATPLNNTNLPASNDLTFGVGFTIGIPRSKNRWAIASELLWHRYKTSASTPVDPNKEFYTQYQYNVDVSYLKLNILPRYIFPTGTVRPFINLGISIGFLVNDDEYKETLFVKQLSGIRTDETQWHARSMESAFIAGAGLAVKQLFVELRYERGNGVSPYVQIASTRSYLGVHATYQFSLLNKKKLKYDQAPRF